MYLGIEIGGTKLQLGVGRGDGSEFVALERRDVQISGGGAGIREQIRTVGRELVTKHRVQRIGYGFGGPVLGAQGIVQTSHQVAGWDRFPLVAWTQQELGVPTTLGNDCDVACLAEACFGAGRDARSVFYVTVGTGIGGGLVFDRKIHGTDRPAAAEIGHLRPGLAAVLSKQTVESQAAGPGLAAAAQSNLRRRVANSEASHDIQDLLDRCGGTIESLTTKSVGEAAIAGNRLALDEYVVATRVLGWAMAQVITIVAPEAVIVGVGVSLVGEEVFFAPLRSAVHEYVFPPLANSFRLLPAALGESVVVHGALALARLSSPPGPTDQ